MSCPSGRRAIPPLFFLLSILFVCAADSGSTSGNEHKTAFESLHDAVRQALHTRNKHTFHKLRKMDYISRLRGVGKSVIADAQIYFTTARTLLTLLVPTPTDRATFGTYLFEKSADLRTSAHQTRKRWTKYARKARQLYNTDCTKGPVECANRHLRTLLTRLQTRDDDRNVRHRRRPLSVEDDAISEKSLYSVARDFARECHDRTYELAAKARKTANEAWDRVGNGPHAAVRNVSAFVREAAPPKLTDLVESFMDGVQLVTRTATAFATRAAGTTAAFARLSVEMLGNECVSRADADHRVRRGALETAVVCVQVVERWVEGRAVQVYRMTIERVGSGGLHWMRDGVTRLKTQVKLKGRQVFVALVAWCFGFKGHLPEIGGLAVGVASFLAGVLLMLGILQRCSRPRVGELCTREDCYCGECPDEVDENGEPVCTSCDCYCGQCSDAESSEQTLRKQYDDEEGSMDEEVDDDDDDEEELLLQEVEDLRRNVHVLNSSTRGGNSRSTGRKETRVKATSLKERERPVQQLSYVDPRIEKPVNVRYESS